MLAIYLKVQKLLDMITYEQVESSMLNPPPRAIIDTYIELGQAILNHPLCIKEQCSYKEKFELGNFCICATSIQPGYIAFILGKHITSKFPDEVINLFFNIDNEFRVQFGKINGRNVDGCICLIHQAEKNFDLQEVYEHIYS
ncbi:MAG: hypothetical protein ACI8P3_000790 [Saprospiraceae bacterium]